MLPRRGIGKRLLGACALVAAAIVPISAPATQADTASPSDGYWLYAADGGIFSFGGAGYAGPVRNQGNDVVGMAATPSGRGYWMVDDDGDVFRAGDAADFGSRASDVDDVGAFAARPTGDGYWMTTRTGSVEHFGAAPDLGSVSVRRSDRIVAMAATTTGNGLWLTGLDGGVFALGDAGFYGSMGGKRLNQPVVGMAPTPTGRGYWLVAADGGIFAFGDARFHGSMGGTTLNRPVVGMAPTRTGRGYWLVAADGGIFAFGDAGFFGSMGGAPLNAPIIGLVARPRPDDPVLGPADSVPGSVAPSVRPDPAGGVPNTSIVSGPAATVDPGAVVFTLAASEAGATFTCSLDGGAPAACSSPHAVSNTGSGSHSLTVRAANAAGVDPTPATWEWRVIPPAILVGAGDIASCSNTDDSATAALVAGIPGTVFTAGDAVYDNGTAAEFANCYGPTWGQAQIKSRTRPAVGNHEYGTAGATGYYGYFGASAGDPKKGYYSYDLGAWHVVVLNSNCSAVGGCQAGSAEEQWLRADLAASAARCTVAYWHHPRFSSASHGSDVTMAAFWKALYDYGADLVVNGHDHDYERFAPQRSDGAFDPGFGLRQFVVGTGGKSHYPFGVPVANSEVRNSDTSGVLKLTLRAEGYDWNFIPIAGKTFTDAGSGGCHGRP